MVGTFDVTKTWVSGDGVTQEDLNGNFTEIEKVVNEDAAEVDNALWDATRILVGTGVAGGTVAAISLTSLSVDLDDYHLEVEAIIDKADTGGDARSFEIEFNNDGNSVSVSNATTGADEITVIGKVTMDFNNKPTAMVTTTYTSAATITLLGGVNAALLTNNIVTQIDLNASGGTPILIGSRFTVYKIRRQI